MYHVIKLIVKCLVVLYLLCRDYIYNTTRIYLYKLNKYIINAYFIIIIFKAKIRVIPIIGKNGSLPKLHFMTKFTRKICKNN